MTSFAAPRLTTGAGRPRFSLASLAHAARAVRPSRPTDTTNPVWSSDVAIAAITIPRF